MNKVELVELVKEAARLTKKDAAVAVDAVFESILNALVEGEEVKVAGFGTFVVKEHAARVGINPSTKEPIQIPAMKSIGFKVSKTAKVRVND